MSEVKYLSRYIVCDEDSCGAPATEELVEYPDTARQKIVALTCKAHVQAAYERATVARECEAAAQSEYESETVDS